MEVLGIILIAVAVIAVTGLLFCVWAIVAIARAIAGMVWPKRQPRPLASGFQACRNHACLCANPGHARFCRRCGQALPALMRLAGSRAA